MRNFKCKYCTGGHPSTHCTKDLFKPVQTKPKFDYFRSDKGRRLSRCKTCGLWFTAVYGLTPHITRVHKGIVENNFEETELPYTPNRDYAFVTCNYCGKEFKYDGIAIHLGMMHKPVVENLLDPK